MSITSSLSYLTCDLPGIGGVIKQRPEDFLVEERPLYEPCGEGEHLYLLVEKNSLLRSLLGFHFCSGLGFGLRFTRRWRGRPWPCGGSRGKSPKTSPIA